MHQPQQCANALDIRAITATDKPALAAFFAGLTPLSQTRRFLTSKPRLSTRELVYFTEIDHRRHVALIALNAFEQIVALTQYAGWSGGAGGAEMAIVIADDHQRCGLGTALGLRLIERARANGVDRLTATTQADNYGCLGLLRRLGFTRRGCVDGLIEADLTLGAGRRQPVAD
jgi:GNAT superfamily N-acetyltransferase